MVAAKISAALLYPIISQVSGIITCCCLIITEVNGIITRCRLCCVSC